MAMFLKKNLSEKKYHSNDLIDWGRETRSNLPKAKKLLEKIYQSVSNVDETGKTYRETIERWIKDQPLALSNPKGFKTTHLPAKTNLITKLEYLMQSDALNDVEREKLFRWVTKLQQEVGYLNPLHDHANIFLADLNRIRTFQPRAVQQHNQIGSFNLSSQVC
jgi:hypothetical protein